MDSLLRLPKPISQMSFIFKVLSKWPYVLLLLEMKRLLEEQYLSDVLEEVMSGRNLTRFEKSRKAELDRNI